MLLSAEKVLALYCPVCEKINYQVFSIFALGLKPFSLQCKCGFTQGQITRQKHNYEIKLLCPSGNTARLLFSPSKLWSASLESLALDDLEKPLGFLGERQEVDTAISSLVKQSTEHEEFVDPDVMYNVLRKLQKLAKDEQIRCSCENSSVGIDVCADKVELVCSFCGSGLLVRATMEEDVELVNGLSEIIMESFSYTYLNEWQKFTN